MLLQTKQLEFQYPNGPRFAFSDLSLNPLSQLAIVGQSGSGKSTLLGILAGLNAPQQGEVLIENKSLYQLAAHEIDAIRGQKMGIVFQKHYLIGALTAAENLKLVYTLNRKVADSARINWLLEAVGLSERIDKSAKTLSVGEQQRLAIARALVLNPPLIFADEPTSSLDDRNAEKVLTLLLDMSQQNQAALVVVTHDHRVKQFITNTLSIGEV